MVARQHDDIISDTDKNLRGPKTYLCAKFGCSTPDCVGGESNKYKDREFVFKVSPKGFQCYFQMCLS